MSGDKLDVKEFEIRTINGSVMIYYLNYSYGNDTIISWYRERRV